MSVCHETIVLIKRFAVSVHLLNMSSIIIIITLASTSAVFSVYFICHIIRKKYIVANSSYTVQTKVKN